MVCYRSVCLDCGEIIYWHYYPPVRCSYCMGCDVVTDTCMEETIDHIKMVQKILSGMSNLILDRAKNHDRSKLESPEAEMFEKFTPLLKDNVYGSPEHNQVLEEMGSALDHHYSKNRHHPQYFRPLVENGTVPDEISGMNLIDLVEMIADWKASSLRSKDGDIMKSIDVGVERFGISPQLKHILINTVDVIEEIIYKGGDGK